MNGYPPGASCCCKAAVGAEAGCVDDVAACVVPEAGAISAAVGAEAKTGAGAA